MTELAVLTCGSCGGPVPLRDAETVTCPYCQASVEVPAEHRALHARREALRWSRKAAEASWGELPEPFPPWLIELLIALFVLAIPGVTVTCLIGWVFRGWFGGNPLTMLTFGILGPLFLLLFLLIDTMTSRAYTRQRLALEAVPDPQVQGLACRQCGAPLAAEPGALAATCDYCGTDSLVVGLSPRAAAKVRKLELETKSSLGDALTALREQRKNRVTVRLVVGGVLAVFWLPLAILHTIAVFGS